MRIRHTAPTHTEQPSHTTRRSFIMNTATVPLGIHTLLSAGTTELIQTQSVEQKSACPHSIQELCQLLGQEFPGVCIQTRKAPEQLADAKSTAEHVTCDVVASMEVPPSQNTTPQQEHTGGIAPAVMLSSLLEQLQEQDIRDVASHSSEWFLHYQLSEDELQLTTVEQKLDCNDHAYQACQKLESFGMPMHLHSIWPKDPSIRLEHSWHQLALCKLQENVYLIIDNAKHATIWHGSLSAFMDQYKDMGASMETIPVFGITEFKQAKHQNPVSKMLIQCLNATSEDGMESLYMQDPSFYRRNSYVQI